MTIRLKRSEVITVVAVVSLLAIPEALSHVLPYGGALLGCLAWLVVSLKVLPEAIKQAREEQ